jgi:hypothetical protein
MKAGGGPDARRIGVHKIDDAPYRKARSDGLTGGFGKVPIWILQDTTLSVFERFLIAYLSVHRAGFGINHRRVRKVIRQLGGRKMVQRAVRTLRKRGLIERKRKPNGYAVDTLTSNSVTEEFVLVECQLFDGTLTAREILALLYVRSCRGHVQQWQLRRVLGDGVRKCGRSVLNRCLRMLEKAGLAKNVGTAARPLWTAPKPKKSTLPKGATLPKRTLPKRPPTRKFVPPRIEATGEEGWDRGPGGVLTETAAGGGTVLVVSSARTDRRQSVPDTVVPPNRDVEFGDHIPALADVSTAAESGECMSDEITNPRGLSAAFIAKRAACHVQVDRLYALRDKLMARAQVEFTAGRRELGERFVRTADVLMNRAERLLDEYFSTDGPLVDHGTTPAKRSPSAALTPVPLDASGFEMGEGRLDVRPI